MKTMIAALAGVIGGAILGFLYAGERGGFAFGLIGGFLGFMMVDTDK